MRKIKAFTLIEVMISIFIFTTAMLGYMAFHAHSMAVLFDNESAQFAHALAFNLVDEINSMSYDAFGYMVGDETTTPQKPGYVGTELKLDSVMQKPELFGTNFVASPFNVLGEQDDSGPYRFYRVVTADSYSNKTQRYTQQGTFLSTLYHVEVKVYWPKKEAADPTMNCFSSYNETQCNVITIPLVRSNHKY